MQELKSGFLAPYFPVFAPSKNLAKFVRIHKHLTDELLTTIPAGIVHCSHFDLVAEANLQV